MENYNDQFRPNQPDNDEDTDKNTAKNNDQDDVFDKESFRAAYSQHHSYEPTEFTAHLTSETVSEPVKQPSFSTNSYTPVEEFHTKPLTEPTMKPNYFKRNIAAIIFAVAFIGTTIFAVIQTVNISKYQNIALTNKTLYEKENLRAGELETELSKTAEGKKSLEKINANLADQNQALDNKATKAESNLQSTQSQLTSKLNELNAANSKIQDANNKLADINKQMADVNKQLDSKKTEITKLNNGIAKFAELETLINTYEQANNSYINDMNSCIGEVNNYMQTGKSSYLTAANNDLYSAQSLYTTMNETSEKMTTIFDQIKSGNY